MAVGHVWYNKYHPVINPNKPDKCRMVFDLSAMFHGVSLNSKLLKGSDLLANQVGVILRFRRYPHAIVADIEKMFHQVRVRPEDASAFRYIWREPGSKHPPSTYEMRVHLFGATSSPAVCCFALQQAAKDSGPHAERLLREVIDNFYVDNWLASFQKKEDGIELASLLVNALKRCGFNLTQFASSDPDVLAEIRSSNRVPEVNMALDGEIVERTLGLVWKCFKDQFELSVNTTIPARVKTKRELLSVSSRIYDPLGFLAAVKLTPKLVFQETCRQNLNWDDPLDEVLVNVWEDWARKLPSLTHLAIPRCMQPTGMNDCSKELHIFADASEYAHGAVAYLRYIEGNRAKCSLVMAKSNLAPIRPSTIPRNELNGALSAARLSQMIIAELQMDVIRVVFWSDSTTVLRWINSSSLKFSAYVGARIGEILELTAPEQWHYVPTDLNPADDASRGIAPSDLHAGHRWFCGPKFLRFIPDQWPTSPLSIGEDNDRDPEIRPSVTTFAAVLVSDRIDALLASVSQSNRLIRSTAYVLRWFYNAKGSPQERTRGDLSIGELHAARSSLVRHEQFNAFRTEVECLRAGRSLPNDSNLLFLRPIIDEQGILRVGGRLSKSKLPRDVRQPILLPRQSRLTRLIIEDVHRPSGCLKEHLSVDKTLHELRRLYWITRGRQTIARILNDCFRCRIQRGKTVQPVMADLPAGRLQYGAPAFANTGVDCFGPFEVVLFRRKVKRWLVLFVCMTSRAVHMEIVFTMTTDSFLSCLWRFEARRGVP